MMPKTKPRFVLHGVLWGLFLSAVLIYLIFEGVSRYPVFLCAGLVLVWTAIDMLLVTIKSLGRYRETPGDPLVDRSFGRE